MGSGLTSIFFNIPILQDQKDFQEISQLLIYLFIGYSSEKISCFRSFAFS